MMFLSFRAWITGRETTARNPQSCQDGRTTKGNASMTDVPLLGSLLE
jgi:hypothetical protein